MNARFSLSAAMFVGFFLTVCHAQAPDKVPVLRELRSAGAEKRFAAALAIEKERQMIIQSLLQIAKADPLMKQARAPKEVAIKLLGDYRSVEAVDYLVEHVLFRATLDPLSDSGELDHFRGYSSAQALLKIGDPSIRAIFRRLSKPCESNEIHFFAYIVRTIDDHKLGMYRLELEAKEAENTNTADGQVKRENLKKLMEKYKKITGL